MFEEYKPIQVWRTLLINGRRTTVRLETSMWEAFDEIIERENITPSDLYNIIDRRRGRMKGRPGLAPTIRVFISIYFRKAFHLSPAPYRALGNDNEQLSPILEAVFKEIGPEPTDNKADDPNKDRFGASV
jgi:predicted DNA-binding ribbon-helix-helix protein